MSLLSYIRSKNCSIRTAAEGSTRGLNSVGKIFLCGKANKPTTQRRYVGVPSPRSLPARR